MANPQRGEVELVVGGETHTLCLTLGALAEIEGLCADGAPMTATRLVDVLGALMRGGGSAAAWLYAMPGTDAAPSAMGIDGLGKSK